MNNLIIKMASHLLLLIFLHIPFCVKAEDLIIHTDNNVYYYPNLDEQETIVLPNNEVIDTDNLIDLESNKEPYRTNEGLELYNTYDNQIFMESEDVKD
jgi:hypothetical protein